MTAGSAVNTDTRVIAVGLAPNVAIGRPPIITATGRAAPSQHAIVPAGSWTPFALLPHVDYVDDPERRPGCGFVGGRVSSIAPLLAPGSILPHARVDVVLRALPEDGDAILRELRGRAGLRSAPGALFARAAWPDTFVATWLDRLRENGVAAQLSVAHAQGSLALRQAWLAVEWDVGVPPGAGLATAAGVAAVGRALIDVVALVDRIAAPERAGLALPQHRETALAALLTALGHVVRHLEAADDTDGPKAARKLGCALDWARTILDAVGVFAVTADAERKRWGRLTSMLDLGEVQDHGGAAALKLDRLAGRLERLRCAALGRRLERTGWQPHVRRSLLRLASPDRQARLALLARNRCDLIFTLAATRRLDRLYRLFPWLAALHGAFPGCAGGALGALASPYEAARGIEVGSDMKRRLADAGQRPGTVARMTVRQAGAVYASPRHTVLAAGRSYAAGAALSAQVTSHVMVRAALEGQSFGRRLSIEATRRGDLGYNDTAALKVERTRQAVVLVQQAQPAFKITARDDDLIRHMGLTLVRHFGAMVHSIWPTSYQRRDLQIHRATIHTGRRPRPAADIHGPWDACSKHRLHQEFVRSMLHTIDDGDDADPVLRDPITAIETPRATRGEAARAAGLNAGSSRKTGAWEGHDEGQGGARRAADEPTVADERGAFLRELVDDARRWRPRDQRNVQPAPRDNLLEDLLLGRAIWRSSRRCPVRAAPVVRAADRPRPARLDRARHAGAAGGRRRRPALGAPEELARRGARLVLGAVRRPNRAGPRRRHRLPPLNRRLAGDGGPRPCAVIGRPPTRPEWARRLQRLRSRERRRGLCPPGRPGQPSREQS